MLCEERRPRSGSELKSSLREMRMEILLEGFDSMYSAILEKPSFLFLNTVSCKDEVLV